MLVNFRVFSIVLLALLASPIAHAAGFDCTKANSRVEKIICSDSPLSEFDDALTATYRGMLDQSFAQEDLRREQREWLKKRNTCGDANCVRAAYRMRFVELANPASIPRGAFWPIDNRPGERSPESERLYQLLVAEGWREPLGEYLDVGDGAYFITMESAPAASGLFYAIPRTNVLLKLGGPFVELRETHRLRESERLFIFSVKGYGFSAYTAVVVANPRSKPSVIPLASVDSDMVEGGCGNHPKPIKMAGVLRSYAIKDINGDGVLDIEVALTETDCASGRMTDRVLQYLYTDGTYKERSLTRP